jgi:hypothetical protein
LSDPGRVRADEPLVVPLSKVPMRGSWFDLGDRTAAQVKDVRMVAGEPVIFAARGADADRARLSPLSARLVEPVVEGGA